MKAYINCLFCLLILLGVSSCSGLYDYTKVNSASFVPDEVRLNMNMSDFELLGATSVSVGFRTYFGIFNMLDEVNGEVYNRRNVKKVDWYGHREFPVNGRINKATYKAVEEYPEADYYVPMYSNRQVMQMFLGRRVKQEMIIKAYKLK